MAVQGCYPPRYRLPGKAHLSTGGEGLMIGDRPRRTVAGALASVRSRSATSEIASAPAMRRCSMMNSSV